ncbi:FxSxx-COOH protein [Actinoplanes sp. NBC_00393]|uniref:FxSxx-COOH cyclophane-containing RiPP peptide n=1 Tax=Actinoplanes sp. NBC_00393 TaxID=2975953 RepID=UPI002E1B7CC0
MDAGEAAEKTPAEWQSVMVDLADSSLEELAELVEHDDSALARALRRVTDELTSPGEPIAGFNSAV